MYDVAYRPHAPSARLLIGYDPEDLLSAGHIARLIDKLVSSVDFAPPKPGPGQPAYHPQMLAKILVLAYVMGIHSSRRIEEECHLNCPFQFLARDDRPSYRTFCTARVQFKEYFERIWLHVLANASLNGIERLGRIAVDSTKIKANVSGSLIISHEHYDELIAEFQRHLDAHAQTDGQEDEQEERVKTETGVDVGNIQIRHIVRAQKKKVHVHGTLTPRCRAHVAKAIQTLENAKELKLKRTSLSDPDARMMPIGSPRKILMGHMLEVAIDHGLVSASGTCNSNTDNDRLKGLVEQAQANSPTAITDVVGDSGYFKMSVILDLEKAGLTVLVPDGNTVARMRKKIMKPEYPPAGFTKIPGRNAYECSQGNVLTQDSKKNGSIIYIAKRECTGCPLFEQCIKNKKTAKRRRIFIPQADSPEAAYKARFDDPEVKKAYDARGPAVETSFAVIRGPMKFSRWSLREKERVAAEASLLTASLQVRKLFTATRRMDRKAA